MKNVFSRILILLSFLGVLSIVLPSCDKDSDGSPPTLQLPSLSIADVTLTEGAVNDTLTIDVTLTGENKANAVVKFAGVASTALTDLDFKILSSGQLVFTPGTTTQKITYIIIADDAKETTETFSIKLFNPSNCTISKDVAAFTIQDDDDNAAGLVIPTTGYTTPTTYPGMNLVWQDEFNADTLNTSFWTQETGAGGWGNNELQHYRPENTTFVNGNLVITAKKQNFGSSNYTSSRMITKGKKQFKYGRVDIRAALPKGQGLWPALWMLGSNIDAVGWPTCGEIDIMELTGHLPSRILGTVHFGTSVATHQYITKDKYLSGSANFQDEFHVFSMIWVADKIEFLVDNELFQTITPASLPGGVIYPFNKNFFFVFNVAVGGTLPGDPDATTPFPQSMIVDYVRVFQ